MSENTENKNITGLPEDAEKLNHPEQVSGGKADREDTRDYITCCNCGKRIPIWESASCPHCHHCAWPKG